MIFYDIIILDSGTSLQYENVTCMAYNNGEWQITNNRVDNQGHGTSVLGLFPHQYKICIFQLDDSENESDHLRKIIEALEYVNENINCRVLLMSFGFIGYNSVFEKVCNNLSMKGIVIVSAFGNQGAITYPAAFESVIGVEGNPYIKDNSLFIVHTGGIVDVRARAGAFGKDNKYLYGNSFAAAFVALKLLSANKIFGSKNEALQFLSKCKGIAPINNCAIFPLNKENYTLLFNSDLMQYNISKVYDVKYASNIGREVVSLDGGKKYIVENIERVKWELFDTMILGHLRELNSIVGKNFKIELLEKCLKYNKNVISYDSQDMIDMEYKFLEKGLQFKYPKFQVESNYGKLHEFITPILAVIGTSKKQCKFTLQLQILRILKRMGADVGFLGTEPNSWLLGADYETPIGYESPANSKNGYDVILYLNYGMHQVDVKGKDIIITGAQSSFLPHNEYNIRQINLDSFSFLYGVKPDALILTVNITDSIEYIQRTISAIENLADCRVILIAINPFMPTYSYVLNDKRRKLREYEISEFKDRVNKIGLPVVVIGDLKYNDLIRTTILKNLTEGNYA